MKAFAYLYNPIRVEQFKSIWPSTRFMPQFLFKTLANRHFFDFKLIPLKKIRSSSGKEIQGYFIVYPFLADPQVKYNFDFMVSLITDAAHLAKKLGAEILGFCDYNPSLTWLLQNISQKLKIALTGGHTFTAWSIFEAIYRAAKSKGIDLKKSTVAFVGNLNPSGILCIQRLAGYAGKIIINDYDSEKFKILKKTVGQLNPQQAMELNNAETPIKEADITINLNIDMPLDPKELKGNSVLIDMSYPQNRLMNPVIPSDITLINGGLTKLPESCSWKVDIGLPENIVYSSMAETMLLALEEKFVNYSLSENINPDKLEEIANFATRHGLEVYIP